MKDAFGVTRVHLQKMWIPGRALKPTSVTAIRRAVGASETWPEHVAVEMGPGWAQTKKGKSANTVLGHAYQATANPNRAQLFGRTRESAYDFKMAREARRQAIRNNKAKAKRKRKPPDGQMKLF
jgi:hypothetical protein